MRILKFFAALLIMLSVGSLLWPGKWGSDVVFLVHHGDTAHMVADHLVENGALLSRLPFMLWVHARHADSKIKVGRYRFKNDRAAYWMLDDMIQGRSEKEHLVIPEGFASWQIADRLQTLTVCAASDFLKVVQERKLEGFLAPATYEMDLGLSAEDVAHRLKTEFDHRWTKDLEARASELGWTQLQAVTMASIIEREVRLRDELPLVAAVYMNRLKKGMRLEADPTVQYAQGLWKKRLTYDDYHRTNSAYNTYLHPGLPPGPICSPGWDAIHAALWPAPSDALFLLAMPDGHHNFSATYREHTNKVNRRNRQNRQTAKRSAR